MILSLLDDESIGRFAAPAGADALMRDLRIERGEAETIAAARETGATCATVVEPTLALALLAKLQRFGRYDARILEDVAHRIRAASSSTTTTSRVSRRRPRS